MRRRNKSALIIFFALVAADAHAASPESQELSAALDSHDEPKLLWQGDTGITAEISNTGGDMIVSGRCRPARPVVVTGQQTDAVERAGCDGKGQYRVTFGQRQPPGSEIIATQVMLDGTIIAARIVRRQQTPVSTPIAAEDLASVFQRARPGDHIVVAPRNYADLKIALDGHGGTLEKPVIIDGKGAVTFSGATRFLISAPNVTLRGMAFTGTGIDTITVAGEGARLTELQFTDCGEPRKTKSECVLIGAGGKRTEVDFNTFARSKSMSVKVRAGNDDAPNQPTDVSIHHNVFRDIDRLSGNGQEPIQIAGPNGGGSNVALRARVEHNLFYRAQGDVEAISLKTPGLFLRWNAFRDMDAAPNVRGSYGDVVTGNLLLRTRPLRVAGSKHRIAENTIICPSQGVGIVLSNGSPGYDVAANNDFENNIVATARAGVIVGAQTQPMEEPAHGNRFSGNKFFLPLKKPVYEVRPPEETDAIMAANTLEAASPGPALCH